VNISVDASCTFIPVDGRFKFIYDSNRFKFRKSQFIKGSKRIVVSHRSSVFILEKSADGTYKVYEELSNWAEIALARRFIQETNDFYFYWRFYNEDNEEIRVVDPKWTDVLAETHRTFHIKDDLYVSYLPNVFLALFDYQLKFTFVNPTKIDQTSYLRYLRNFRDYSSVKSYELDDIVFKSFKITPNIIKELTTLESLDNMKEYLLRKFTFNAI
jgi:hypothetical protein